MNIHPLQKHFYLFSESSSSLKLKAQSYFPRFNYAACELWLCTELCHIINFGELNLHSESKGDIFIYNEDCKRDLTLYSDGLNSKPKKLLHIEAKIIYPSSGRYNTIKDLCNKLNRTRTSDYIQEGWVYLVWTQHYGIQPDNFFDDRIKWMKEAIESNDFIDKHGNKLKAIYSEIHEICDGELRWRGSEKRIIVKAIAFSFEVDIKDCAKKIIDEYAVPFRNLASM